MTIKQFVEEMTDQRIHQSPENWKMLQHSLYVRVLRPESLGIRKEFNNKKELRTYHELHKKAVIIITNTPY